MGALGTRSKARWAKAREWRLFMPVHWRDVGMQGYLAAGEVSGEWSVGFLDVADACLLCACVALSNLWCSLQRTQHITLMHSGNLKSLYLYVQCVYDSVCLLSDG